MQSPDDSKNAVLANQIYLNNFLPAQVVKDACEIYIGRDWV